VKILHAANDNLKDESIGRTREVWQPRFFSVLAEWARAEMPTPANDAGKPAASDDKEVRDDR
jgi:hypothetical protein